MNLFISFLIVGIIIAIVLSFFGEKISMNLQWIITTVWIIISLIYFFGLAIHLITF